MLETNLDDFDPELWQWVEGKLFEAGALDVWRTSASMKKGRLGICLSVLCPFGRAEAVAEVLLTETTAIGLRRFEIEKSELKRDLVAFDYAGERLRFKRVYWREQPLKFKVEYEDLAAFAKAKGQPILEVQRALKQYLEEDDKWKNL